MTKVKFPKGLKVIYYTSKTKGDPDDFPETHYDPIRDELHLNLLESEELNLNPPLTIAHELYHREQFKRLKAIKNTRASKILYDYPVERLYLELEAQLVSKEMDNLDVSKEVRNLKETALNYYKIPEESWNKMVKAAQKRAREYAKGKQ